MTKQNKFKGSTDDMEMGLVLLECIPSSLWKSVEQVDFKLRRLLFISIPVMIEL